jgi:hypothetical protein
VLHEPLDGDLGIADEGYCAVYDLAEIVGRDVGGDTNGDPGGAVEQEKRQARGQHHGLLHGAVVVGREVDGVLFEILQQLLGDPGHPDLRVSHGRRRVAVEGAEVALAVDERVAQREVLRHAHDRVVGGRVGVGVVLAVDVADDAGRLLVGPVPAVAHLVHGEQGAPVDGLEPVAHVGDGTPDDDAHGVVHVGLLHLVFDVHRDVLLIELHEKRLSFGKQNSPLPWGEQSGGSAVRQIRVTPLCRAGQKCPDARPLEMTEVRKL